MFRLQDPEGGQVVLDGLEGGEHGLPIRRDRRVVGGASRVGLRPPKPPSNTVSEIPGPTDQKWLAAVNHLARLEVSKPLEGLPRDRSALAGYGLARFLSGEIPRNGQQAVIAVDVIALMDALRIDKAIVAGCDWGARTANIVAALWPERCKAMVSVSGYLIGSREANRMPLPPKAELEWWYQFYFATERGRAGYEANRREFAKLIWRLASPRWHFDDAIFDRSAASFENPDHVAIVIHNYRWRLGLADGESKYDELEERLARAPGITVPTITLEGDANGAPHPDPKAYAKKFSGRYAHRDLKGGIGHNLPQEAPQAFAKAGVSLRTPTGPRKAAVEYSF